MSRGFGVSAVASSRSASSYAIMPAGDATRARRACEAQRPSNACQTAGLDAVMQELSSNNTAAVFETHQDTACQDPAHTDTLATSRLQTKDT